MANAGAGTTTEDLAKLLLRIVLGLLVLLHGIAKIRGGPGFILEVVAPLLVIAGLWTRAASLVIAVNMIFAVALVDMGNLFTISETGGWALELQGLFLAAAVAVALLGAGRYSVGGTAGRWN